MSEQGLIVAAGAVVLRRRAGVGEVLVVHRPKYDDWSLPKGKLDPGEDARTAAVREVLEESGAWIRLGPPLTDQAYTFDGGNRTKLVRYWVGRLMEDHETSAYEPNEEVDEVRWVSLEDAAGVLTHAHDAQTVAEARQFLRKSHPLVVLRHAWALDRDAWDDDDEERPLTEYGEQQAGQVVPVLASYGVERLVSSSSRRCWTTVAPYGVVSGMDIEVTDALNEVHWTDEAVDAEVEGVVAGRQATVVCSHRKVLPRLFEALHLDPPELDKAAMVVVHHRRGRITAIERIPAP
jgi:8-oxo-dGTP diphosphatase